MRRAQEIRQRLAELERRFASDDFTNENESREASVERDTLQWVLRQ